MLSVRCWAWDWRSRHAGKTVQMVLADGVPSSFRHLQGADEVKTCGRTAISTRSSRWTARTSSAPASPSPISVAPTSTSIITSPTRSSALLNLIEGEEVATSAILTNHLPAWGYPITAPIAAALLDRHHHRYARIPHVKCHAGGHAPGGDPDGNGRGYARPLHAGLGATILRRRTRIGARGLSNLERKDGIVYGSLSLEDRKAAGYSGTDDADLINVVSAIDGFKVAMIFVEQPKEHVKISWRALEPGHRCFCGGRPFWRRRPRCGCRRGCGGHAGGG